MQNVAKKEYTAKEAEAKIRKYIASNGTTLRVPAIFTGVIAVLCAAVYIYGLTTPYGSHFMWIVDTVGCAALFAVFFSLSRTVNGGAAKSIKALKEADMLEQAAAELTAPSSIIIGKKQGVGAQHFIYGRDTGAALRYTDILWIYADPRGYIRACTADRKNIPLIKIGRKDFEENVKFVMHLVMAHAPNAISDNTKESREQYEALVRQLKEKQSAE